MPQQGFVCTRRRVLGLMLVGCVVGAGCESGSKDSQVVTPEVPPDVAAQKSMEAYKAQMKTKGHPGQRK